MKILDKFKSTVGASPYVSDVTKFITDSYSGNDLSNEKLTENSSLLGVMQRQSTVKLRDAISNVIVQDVSATFLRQSVLTGTVGELVGLENRIIIAELNKVQAEEIAKLEQSGRYDVANLQGELKKELTTIDGQIDVEMAIVNAEAKVLLATEVGTAIHDGKVDIEKQTSRNNIELANIDGMNDVKIAEIKGNNIVKMGVIDAAVIKAESDIDVAGVKSASDIAVFGIAREADYDANFIKLQAINEAKLKDIATVHEVQNIATMGDSEVSLTHAMAISEKGVTEVSAKIESTAIKSIAGGEAKSIAEMAAAKASATESNANIDATFTRLSAVQDGAANESMATMKKGATITEAIANADYSASRSQLKQGEMRNDATLSDSISLALSNAEIANIKTVNAAETENIVITGKDKVESIKNLSTVQIENIKSISVIERDTIKANADTRLEFTKQAADFDAENDAALFSIEKERRISVSKITLAGDTKIGENRIKMQAEIDAVETNEIKLLSDNDIATIRQMAKVDADSEIKLTAVEINAINQLAAQRANSIKTKSSVAMANERFLSETVKIPSIKSFSALKIKEYSDRGDIENQTNDSMLPERLRVINVGRDLRVNQIIKDATVRDKAARTEADTTTAAQEANSKDSIDMQNKFLDYLERIKILSGIDKSLLAEEAGYYAANTVHKTIKYKTDFNLPLGGMNSRKPRFGSTSVEPPPDFQKKPDFM
jgi:hypothetical protein